MQRHSFQKQITKLSQHARNFTKSIANQNKSRLLTISALLLWAASLMVAYTVGHKRALETASLYEPKIDQTIPSPFTPAESLNQSPRIAPLTENTMAGNDTTTNVSTTNDTTTNDTTTNNSKTGADQAKVAAPTSEHVNTTTTKKIVAKGDTLVEMLIEHGLDANTAYAIIAAIKPNYDPGQLKVGQSLEIVTQDDKVASTRAFVELTLQASPEKNLVVTATNQDNLPDNLVAKLQQRPTTSHLIKRQGTINSSLYVAAIEAGMSQKTLANFIAIFAFDIDFQREIQKGDHFALLYKIRRDEAGKSIDSGDILLAEMVIREEVRRYYKFEDQDGMVDYYDKTGQSVRKALLKTPIDGARISSNFGTRKHPILGYSHVHKGVDFAAPSGTPIFAAGDGVIEAVGWNGGYGNYVRIRHNGTYKTAYAHLSRYAKVAKKGARVKQRQIIGYVGSTGRSTGPHLHYEIIKDNKQINPLKVKLPSGKKLSADELTAFKKIIADIEAQFAAT